MKKNLFNYLLIGLGILSIIFAVVCFSMIAEEPYFGTGSFSRMEGMLEEVALNTMITTKCISLGFGFTLIVFGLTLILFGVKRIKEEK